MPQQTGQSGHGRAFHLVVHDAPSVVDKPLDLGILLRIGQGKTQTAPLRPVKSAGRKRNAARHVLSGYLFGQSGIGMNGIGMSRALRTGPTHVSQEGLFQPRVAHIVASGVIIQQTVQSDGYLRTDERAQRRIRLQSSAGAYANDVERRRLFFQATGAKVYVCQCIQLVHHDVDVVTPYSRGDHADAFSAVTPRDGVKFATLHIAFARFKMGGHKRDAPGVAHQNDARGQLRGKQMQMKHGTVCIENQFRRCYGLFHGFSSFKGVTIPAVYLPGCVVAEVCCAGWAMLSRIRVSASMFFMR